MKDYLGDAAFPDDTWTASTPEAEGMDPAPRFGGFSTHGYMGQHLYVLPDRDLAVVFTGALVPPERADATLDDFVSTFILPAAGGA